jgi:hypothetical protein
MNRHYLENKYISTVHFITPIGIINTTYPLYSIVLFIYPAVRRVSIMIEVWEGIRGPVTADVSEWEGFDLDTTMGEVMELQQVVDSIVWASLE